METAAPQHRVVSADRMDGGVIIVFEDGKCALYPASLLYATLPQAEQLNKFEPDPED